MRIIHYGHSCVLVETVSARLLIDPGTMAHRFETVRDLDAILVTHQHPDHIDPARLPALVAANRQAALVVDKGSADIVAGLGLSATIATPGELLSFGGADVRVVGGTHAAIHRDVTPVPNNGYVVDTGAGAFYHPGDSLVAPEPPVDVLGVPTAAPWLHSGQAGDFLRAVAPRVAVPIHQGMLASPQVYYFWLEQLAPVGTSVTVVPTGELTDV
jgi:L-ascorbate metabolism protein UlaG (beta-lactamase superfamily)